jgi:hypothetical protein
MRAAAPAATGEAMLVPHFTTYAFCVSPASRFPLPLVSRKLGEVMPPSPPF